MQVVLEVLHYYSIIMLLDEGSQVRCWDEQRLNYALSVDTQIYTETNHPRTIAIFTVNITLHTNHSTTRQFPRSQAIDHSKCKQDTSARGYVKEAQCVSSYHVTRHKYQSARNWIYASPRPNVLAVGLSWHFPRGRCRREIFFSTRTLLLY